ncbi:winged helix-turn-helix domain-containing protein [Vibrio campbellii]|uniref:winged helix-turn-helix domain-containing protein n=1 Tax=Vibrio campbellii TaxID=680 RepID=UPI001F174891|nr:winged helix-turn-helix domain-containing protein [Vibrio campbellii]MCE7733189.1 winged helix-turn-helix domain-containing protein [Vibrio campbellii]
MKVIFSRNESVLSFGGRKKKIGYRDALVLEALLANEGDVLSKDFLLEYAWRNTIVTEISLTTSIHSLRVALKSLLPEQDVIVTIPRLGYRLNMNIIETEKPSLVKKQKRGFLNVSGIIFFLIFSSLFFLFNDGLVFPYKTDEIKVYALENGNVLFSTSYVDKMNLSLLSQIDCNCEIFFNSGYISIFLLSGSEEAINFTYSNVSFERKIEEINFIISKGQ